MFTAPICSTCGGREAPIVNGKHISPKYCGEHKVKVLINKAAQEQDTEGYRENLGYDLQPILEDYLSNLDLDYSEHTQILAKFHRACDQL